MAHLFLVIFAVLIAIGVLGTFGAVGKQRKPVTEGQAYLTAFFGLVELIGVFYIYTQV